MKKFKNYIKQNYINIIVKLAIIAIFLTLDLLTKSYFAKNTEKQDFIPGFIYFTFVKNTGAAFGIFANGSAWLLVFSVLFLIVFVLYDIGNKEQNWWSHIGFAFIFAGALGNMIDRILLQYVRDFIAFDFIDFPVFNIADVCITIGCVLYVIYLITYAFGIKRKKKIAKNKKNEDVNNFDTNTENQ